MVEPHSMQELAAMFSDLGKDLLSERGLDSTLGLVSSKSVEIVADARHAAVSRGRHGKFETVGATSDVPLQVDQIQYQLGSGPCVDAAIEEAIFRAGSLLTDPRWQDFGKRAVAENGHQRHAVGSAVPPRRRPRRGPEHVFQPNWRVYRLGQTVGMMLADIASDVTETGALNLPRLADRQT